MKIRTITTPAMPSRFRRSKKAMAFILKGNKLMGDKNFRYHLYTRLPNKEWWVEGRVSNKFWFSKETANRNAVKWLNKHNKKAHQEYDEKQLYIFLALI